jgi:hypothetical protein
MAGMSGRENHHVRRPCMRVLEPTAAGPSSFTFFFSCIVLITRGSTVQWVQAFRDGRASLDSLGWNAFLLCVGEAKMHIGIARRSEGATIEPCAHRRVRFACRKHQDMIVQYCASSCSDTSEDLGTTALRMQGLMGPRGLHRSVHVPSVTS